jgi:ribosomal protein S18 acetylase RimI-like enzyme
MTSIKIRILTSDDAAQYRRVRLESLEREPAAFGSSPEDHHKLSEQEIRQRIAADCSEHFVLGAFADGELVGMAGFARLTNRKERHRGRIWGVYLQAERRGQGIGRRLMDLLLERVRAIDGLEQILLSVTLEQAAAAALYRSLGFVPWGREIMALRLDGRYIDEEHMVLWLAKSGQ